MNEKDHIKELFQKKLSDYEAKVPDNSWERLEASLITSSKKRILYAYRSAVAVAAVVLIIVGVFIITHSPTEYPKKIITHHAPSTSEEGSITPRNRSEYLTEKREIKNKIDELGRKTKGAAATKEGFQYTLDKRQKYITENITISSIYAQLPISSSRNVESLKIEKLFTHHLKKETTEEEADKEYENTQRLLQEFIDAGQKAGIYPDELMLTTTPQKLTLAMNSNSNLTSFSETTREHISLRSAKAHSLTSQRDIPRYEPSKAKLAHNQPISLGLMLAKPISENVFIEGGVMYTYLSSSSNKDSPSNDKQEQQSIYYIGIPININYKIVSWHKAELYLALGSTLQKDVYGKFSYQEQHIKPETNSSSNERKILKIRQKNPQFSINSGIGIAYPIYNDLKLYGKIGAAYYFETNNEFKTIYSDQKFALDVNIGLKIEL